MSAPLRSPWFVLIVATCVVLEWLWRSASRRGYDGRGARMSLLVGIGRVIFAALGGLLLSGVFLSVYRLAPWHLPINDARAWLAGFFVVEANGSDCSRNCATRRTCASRCASPSAARVKAACVSSRACYGTNTMMILVPIHCQGGFTMPRGSQSSYTAKQKRKAEHIEEGYEERGVSRDEAEERAWRTVNKQDGGGKKSGSGRKHGGAKKASAKKSPAKKSSAKKSSSKKSVGKKSAGKKSSTSKKSGSGRKRTSARKSSRSRG